MADDELFPNDGHYPPAVGCGIVLAGFLLTVVALIVVASVLRACVG